MGKKQASFSGIFWPPQHTDAQCLTLCQDNFTHCEALPCSCRTAHKGRRRATQDCLSGSKRAMFQASSGRSTTLTPMD
jgi:hypothetical protein